MKRSNLRKLGGGNQPPPPSDQPSLEDLQILPEITSVREILNFLLSVQQKKWNKTILPVVPYPALQKHLSVLLKTHSPKTILTTILQLAEVAKGPFSVSAIKRYLEKEKCNYSPSEAQKE